MNDSIETSENEAMPKTQTTAEKLRIIADALEAGEYLNVRNEKNMHENLFAPVKCSYAINNHEFLEIRRIPATIQVGKRTINAPMRVMPSEGAMYWCYWDNDYDKSVVSNFNWDCDVIDHCNFNNANCWHTEADARAYAEASLAVRKGDV